MRPDHDFPRLTPTNHRDTSPATVEYNCIAWANGVTDRWWQPGEFWPTAARVGDYGIATLIEMFVSLGFETCPDDTLEDGFEKVAVYGGILYYTHAARQLPNGRWTSKLGKAEDIEHDTPDAVTGGVYGEVIEFMRRPIQR